MSSDAGRAINTGNSASTLDDFSIDAEVKPKSGTRKRRKKLTAHRAAYLVHSFIGLKLSLIFSIVLLTGSIAVFSDELDWLLYSEIRVTPQGEKLNEGEIFDRLQAAMPNVGLAALSTANDKEATAAHARMTLPGGGFKKIWIDPYTGEITGTTNFLTVGEFFSILHHTLFMPVIGRALVNVFGVLCLIGLISGLISYRRFWREFFTLPRWNAKSRIFLGDLHKFIGLWSIWFVLIIGVTGSWWFYQTPLVRYKVAPQFLPSTVIDPQLSHEHLAALGKGIPTPLTSKDIVSALKKHDPDFVIHFLIPPEHNGMAYQIGGTKHDLLTSKWDSRYFLNPFTGDIIGSQLAEDLPNIMRVDKAMVPLHYGTWGYSGNADLSVKIIWCFFGLAMSALSISGMIIYYKRTQSATRKLLPTHGKSRTLQRTWFAVRPWGGPMSSLKYVNWIFVIVIGIGISIGFKIQKEGTAGSGYLYTEQNIGQWSISLNATLGLLEKDLDPIQAGRQTTINAFIKSGDPDAIKFMYARVNKPRTTRAPGSVIHGSLGNQHAHMPVPQTLKDSTLIWLTIEDWSGEFYQVNWPLQADGKATVDMRIAPQQEVTSLH
ncbi:hypothetical protein A9Q99_20490 [Gammaproteobacteria bacterium 45_16_T64]|nr:hypothetical protein A9Q99_20490 [Gammaproteobacteria bacterium 45_16_T64]